MTCLGQEPEIARNLVALAGPYARQVATLFAENCWRKADAKGLALWNAVLDLIATPEAGGNEPMPPPRPSPQMRRMLHPSYEMVADVLTGDGAGPAPVISSR